MPLCLALLYLSLSNDVVIKHVLHLATGSKLGNLSPETYTTFLLKLNSHIRCEGDNCGSELTLCTAAGKQ